MSQVGLINNGKRVVDIDPVCTMPPIKRIRVMER